MSGENIFDRIIQGYNSLTRSEMKVADYILKHTHKTLMMNVSKLASVSGVSDATVVRMCKHLGYKGYNEMRLLLSRDMGKKDMEFDSKAPIDSVQMLFIATFQAGWFIESMWSQTLVIHMIRTPKIPFIQSHASAPVIVLTVLGIVTLTVIPFTPLGSMLGLAALPPVYFAWLAGTILCYMTLATLMKTLYVKRYGELL